MRSTPHPHDLALARRAARADGEAWEELIERYGGKIYNLSCRFAGAGYEAEDLTQEIFLKLYRNLHRYRGDVPLVAWALRLSRNLCIDRFRHSRARQLDAMLPEEAVARMPADADPEGDAYRREQLRIVHQALAEMPESLATVVALRDLSELAYDEIAVFLELPLGTVKSRLSRARRALVAVIDQRLAASEDAERRESRSSC